MKLLNGFLWKTPFLLCIVFPLTAQTNYCTVPVGKTTFNDATVNGTIITNPQQSVKVEVKYMIPAEEIARITAQLQELQALQRRIELDKLNIQEQQELLEKKEAELLKQQKEVDQERAGMQEEKENMQIVKDNFQKEVNEVKQKFESLTKTIPSQQTATTTQPVLQKMQELKEQGQRMIESTESCLSSDFAITTIKNSKTGKVSYGFSLDAIRKNPHYVIVDNYIEGYARVKRSNKFGFYNQEGKLVIDFKYDYVESFKNRKALVKNVGKWFVIDVKEQRVLTFNEEVRKVKRSQHYFHCQTTEGVYLADSMGVKLSDYYDEIDFPTEYGITKIKDKSGKYGYINILTKEVIGSGYNEVMPFDQHGLSVIKDWSKGHVYGVMNEEGKIVVPFKEYRYISAFNEKGVAIVENRVNKYGVINEKGEVVLKCIYTKISNFHGNSALVEKDSTYSFINKRGQVISKPKFGFIADFNVSNHKIIKKKKYRSNTIGLLSLKTKKIVIPCQYAKISCLSSHFILAQTSNKVDLYFVSSKGHIAKIDISNHLDQKELLRITSLAFEKRKQTFLQYKIHFKNNTELNFVLNEYNLKAIVSRLDIEEFISKYDENMLLTLLSIEEYPYLIDHNFNIIYKNDQTYAIGVGDNQTYLVMHERGYFFLNTKGEQITRVYDRGTQPFNDGFAIIVKNTKKGLINPNGLEVIPPLFDVVEIGYNCFNNDKQDLINLDNLVLIDTAKIKFDCFTVMHSGTIFKLNKEGKCLSANKETYNEIIRKYYANQ